MTCRDVAEFLMAYLSGELLPERRAVFDRHLEGCPDCRAYLATYERTIALAQAACGDPDAPPAPDVPAELVQAIVAASGRTT
jgi:anti-sigma factor RsiW